MVPDNEMLASNIARELADEISFAKNRPARHLIEIDIHLDKLMERVERLALIVARLAAGSE